MSISYWLFGFGLILLLHQSLQQEPLPYNFGYRSSYRFHPYGNINLIISAPHGGNVTPSDVPERAAGGCGYTVNTGAAYCTWNYNDTCVGVNPCNIVTARDPVSDDFAFSVANELNKTWGYKPFVVLGLWARRKVEYNRAIIEGTLQHPEAVASYRGYHSFINETVDMFSRNFGTGLLIDIHGHSIGNFTMVGYLLGSGHLSVTDLNTLRVKTSIEPVCGSDRNECIRGRSAFGSKLEQKGFGMVYPSLANPSPGNQTFYDGGYITSNYLSKTNAIQIELSPLITSSRNRTENVRRCAEAIVEFMQERNILRSLTSLG